MNNGQILIVSDDSFETDVINADRPVLLDFWRNDCPPCKQIAPHVEEIATEQSGVLTVGSLNVDDNQGTLMRYGIHSAPTLILFKNGRETVRIVGYEHKKKLLAKLKLHVDLQDS